MGSSRFIRHMKVDVFGRCGHKKCGKNISIKTLGSFDQDKCNAEIGQYMFYFALENAICKLIPMSYLLNICY